MSHSEAMPQSATVSGWDSPRDRESMSKRGIDFRHHRHGRLRHSEAMPQSCQGRCPTGNVGEKIG